MARRVDVRKIVVYPKKNTAIIALETLVVFIAVVPNVDSSWSF